MDKTQEGLEEDYLPKTVSDDFKDLFDQVCKLTQTKAIDNSAKKFRPPISSPEFCREFFVFLKPKQSNLQRKTAFEKFIIKELNVEYNTFLKWQSNGIPEKGNYSHACFCISAQVHETKIEKHLADFLKEWVDRHDPDISLRGLVDFKRDIQKLRAKYNLSDGQYPFETQLDIHGIDRVKGQEKWLSPCNYDALPLFGREKETKLLDKFIESDGQFKIWAIAGPSGSGKTRLAFQWAYFSDVLNEWDRHILHKEDLSTPKKWENWSPDKPTLIIIDYLYGFEEVVLELMNRRSTPTKHKIRLLLIDHVFSEPLHSDKRWGFSGDQQSFDRNEKFFHDPTPLDLEYTENQDEIIKSIIAERVGIGLENSQIEEAHDYLLNTEGAYRPLFAALISDAIISGKDFKVWNRRELISYYLSGEKRLPWEHDGLALNGRWASYFIAVATARREMHYCDLFKAAQSCEFAPKYFAGVKKICQKVVADKNVTILKPFEPDIIGESFFLQFIQYLEEAPEYQAEFRQVFLAGNKDTQTEDATELIAFIHRLTRNLLNDDQQSEKTQALWNAFFNFIHPSDFENAEPLKWALTAGVIGIVDEIKNQFPKEKLIAFLNRAEPTVLYHVHDSRLVRPSIFYSMCFLELKSKLTNTSPEFPEEFFALFNRHTNNEVKEVIPLINACYYGFNKLIDAFICRGVDIETTLTNGINALISACIGGQTEAIKQLLNTGGKIHVTDNDGRTALIWASVTGHTEVVELLLDKGAKINATDYRGRSALFYASTEGRSDVVNLLLDRGTKINAADNDGFTALIWASCENQVEVVKLLLDNDADINAADNGSCSALMWASLEGHVEVVNLLLANDIKINAADNDGFTALIWASYRNQVEVVKLLLDNDADINAVDNAGLTAFIWACNKGHMDVVILLLDEKVKVDAAKNKNQMAFFAASAAGHVDVTKLLLDQGEEIDTVDKEGNTALIWACIFKRTKVIQLLLKREARVDIVNNDGFTPLSISKKNRNKEIVKLLVEYGAKN